MRKALVFGLAFAAVCGMGVRLATAAPPAGDYGAYGEGSQYGLYGSSTGTTGSCYGGAFFSTATGPTGWGVYAKGTYSGVQGVGTATDAKAYGGLFVATGHTQSYGTYCNGSYIGTYGLASRSSNVAYGGYFLATASATGIGSFGKGAYVGGWGQASGTSGNAYGGVFYGTSSPSGYGVFAQGTKYGVYGHANATTGLTAAGYFKNSSSGGIGVWANAGASSGSTKAIFAQCTSATGYAGYFDGRLHVTGDLTCGGNKNCVVRLKDGTQRVLYAVESPESWFEDLGTAQLKHGVAVVKLAEDFAQTVNTLDAGYHIFLTPLGDCRGLYVAQKTVHSFEVRELGSGQTDVAFDYRIMAKRLGHEKERLNEVQVDGDFAAVEGEYFEREEDPAPRVPAPVPQVEIAAGPEAPRK